MLRLVCAESGQVWPDILGKAPGRGAYVCWDRACMARLHDRHFRAAWKERCLVDGQVVELKQRSAVALLHLCRQYVHRQRSSLKIGRDAVMRRMWAQTPVMVVLASDAGDALTRQVGKACANRRNAGLGTVLVPFGDAALLGGFLGRERLAVLAMDDKAAGEKLRQYCNWYGQLQEME